MTDITKSYFALKQKISAGNLKDFDYTLKTNESLKVIKESNRLYVQPIFSIQHLLNERTFDESTVILISAAGATGKTALTHQLSYDIKAPILDLSKHEPVASNSLTGLLIKCLELTDFTSYMTRLKDGTSTMIIDAFDEALLKTTTDGFYSFIDDIINIAKDSTGTPFVLLGRTNVIELITLYMEEKGLNVVLLQIEPFTEEQARRFIDNHVNEDYKTKHKQQYEEVRNYIICTIEGFFKNQSEINHKQFTQFLGYAPVLLAISTLLRENANYQMLLTELKSSNKRNVDLIIEIIERILNREQFEKIGKQLLPSLLKGRDVSFIDKAHERVYNIEEQCARILFKVLKRPYNSPIMDDATFDTMYNQQIEDWLSEHPFLSNNKIANIVFESYMISALINIPYYKDYVLEYLDKIYTNAYTLFYIYNALSDKNRIIDKEFLKYLYNSLCALDKKGNSSSMELFSYENDVNSNAVKCELLFIKENTQKSLDYKYYMEFAPNESLSLGANISNMTIDAPIAIELSHKKVEFIPPVYINCLGIKCSVEEILLTPPIFDNSKIVFKCENFETILTTNGALTKIKKHCNHSNNFFEIHSRNKLFFPFDSYHQETEFVEIPSNIKEQYSKMRRLILMFRSHSKGKLARFKDKIDNRIGNVPIGEKVLTALITSGVIYTEEHLYLIDNEKMASVLGVKYDDVRSCVINEKIEKFLREIDV